MFRYLILFSLFLTEVHAQKESKVWYFGDGSGIDFNLNPPAPLTNGAMFTYDCSSAIADTNGNILFYTNGVTIWNKQHATMMNGSGLSGNNSGGQSALIIPKPGSNLYYVFTVPDHGFGGLCYSIVDMSTNGGLGSVISKNNILHSPTTEKLAAYYDCNLGFYWLISHKFNSNQFYAYKIDASGLITIPVISAVGATHTGGNPSTSQDAMGQMVLSKSGNRLATAQQFQDKIQIFDFNTVTGIVSNPQTINSSSPWGLAFSPDGQKLYVSHWLGMDVEQIDCSGSTPGSPILIGTVSGTGGVYGAGYMELGPDDIIYIAKWHSTYLATINQPNGAASLCGFTDNGFYLGGKISQAGICRTVQNPHQNVTIQFTTDCNLASLTLSDTTGVSNVHWYFGDGTTGNGNAVQHSYLSGTYTVSAIVTWCGSNDSISNTFTISPNQNNFSVSTNSNCDYTTGFQLNGTNIQSANWQFSNGTTSSLPNPMIQFTGPGNYNYTIIAASTTGCIDTIQGNIFIDSLPVADFTYTIDPCSFYINLQNTSTGANGYLWDFGDGQTENSTNPIHNYSYPGNFIIQLISSNQSGCKDTISKSISIDSLPAADFSFSLNPCMKSISLQNISTNAASQIWYFGDGSNDSLYNPVHTYSQTGNYSVTLIAFNQSGCTDTAQQIVNITSNPIISIHTALDSCSGNYSFYFTPSVTLENVHWDFGDNTSSNSINPHHTFELPGTYEILLIHTFDSACIDSSILEISVDNVTNSNFTVPNCFTPNGDGRNDFFSIPENLRCKYHTLEIYNRWGIRVFRSSNSGQSWNGTFNNTDLPEGVYVYLLLGNENKIGTVTLIR